MKLKFSGDQAVRIPGVGNVEPGQTVDVPTETGRSLVRRPQWQEVKTTTTKDKE